ncbi:alpha/beta fold hydrolase [Roseovarius sp. B08]|uniref:alpha/beta fold hydrolase n=1 Tax=Roseovarius sp. B08 TaxID=3449223 RepID=UPI003EDBF6F5
MPIPGFRHATAQVNGIHIAYSTGGSGPPLLLLHGFPQTHALWARVAPALAETHTVICPDLRGYGDSAKPQDVSACSFREMARDQTALMSGLGHTQFAVAGHDRGGRVAHRLSLDAPDAVTSLCLMDIVPTHTLLTELRMDVAQAYYHWFFLAQPGALIEDMIAADPDAYFHSCLTGWGAADLSDFDPDQLAAYRDSWRRRDTIRGMCNDYRAAIAHDVHHDADDLESRIACPTLILYGRDGAMARAYDVPATWAPKCIDMRADTVPGGHFFIDTSPDATISRLRQFFC